MAAIAEYAAEQCRAIRAGDRALDTSHATAVHETRVAIRRLRSVLRVFGELLQPLPVTALDVELQWYAAALGEVRDCQILRLRLDGLITKYAEQIPAPDLPALRGRIEAELRREYAQRWLDLELERHSERHHRLMTELDEWAEELPSLDEPQRSDRLLRKLIRVAKNEVPRKLKKGLRHDDTEKLHAARKASKRARYAAEAAAPVLGIRAGARTAKRYKKLQELLGEHQDAALSADFLRRLSTRPDVELGEMAAALDFLLQRELRRATRSQRRAHKSAGRFR